MSLQDPIVGRYLAQFRASLRALPEGERNEVAQEIESHIAEALAVGRSLAEVLERLGPADRLARAYTADALLGEGRPSVARWLKAAGVMAGLSLSSLFIVPVLAIFGIAVPFFAVVGFIGNIVQYFYPPAGEFGGTHIPGAGPVTTLVVGELAAVALFALGLGAFQLLKRYVRMLIRSVRGALS